MHSSELTEAPSIQHEIQDHVQDPLVSAGQRKVILEWKVLAFQGHFSFYTQAL